MDRAVLPPRPDLLGDVGQERREQPQLDVQRDRERGPGRVGRGAAVVVVGALLDQLEVVVAELPEELLGDLERGGVVVGVERLGGPAHDDLEPAEQRAVDRRADGARVERGRADVAEDELGGVEHLHRQAAPDLHLRLVEGRVHAGTTDRGTPADRVGAVLVEDVGRDDDVALRLRHLLAVGVDDEAGDHRVRPRDDVVLEVGADDAGEQPGADDVVRLGGQVVGEDPREEVVVDAPHARDLRGERGGRPGVHHVGVAHEAAGLAALVLGVALAAPASTGRPAAGPRAASAGGRGRGRRRRRGGTRPGTGCRRTAGARSASRR